MSSANLTSTGATIAWTTNEASSTQVEYGTTTSYGTSSALNSSMVTSHSQALSGLSASTLYHYRVRSADAAGNAAVSGDYTFTTPAPPDTTAPVISSVTSSNLTSTGATIAWTTNEAASTQVEYGTTTGYGTSSALNSSMVTSHTQALSGLTASTLYHYRVKSADAAGNAAVSGDYTFTTPAPPDTTAPVISSVTSSNLTSSGATIAWTTNEAASTQVEYGTTTGYGTSSALNSSMVTSHTQALSGLSASTLYHYRVKSADAAGNAAVSGDYTFTTPAPPDTTAPVISGVTSSNLTSTGATIPWTTNEAANTQVEYGTTTSYGTSSCAGQLHGDWAFPVALRFVGGYSVPLPREVHGRRRQSRSFRRLHVHNCGIGWQGRHSVCPVVPKRCRTNCGAKQSRLGCAYNPSHLVTQAAICRPLFRNASSPVVKSTSALR